MNRITPNTRAIIPVTGLFIQEDSIQIIILIILETNAMNLVSSCEVLLAITMYENIAKANDKKQIT